MEHTVQSSPRVQPSPGASGRSPELEAFLREFLGEFPWQIDVSDWSGLRYQIGLNQPHWRNEPLRMHFGTPDSAQDVLTLRPLRFLDRFLAGDVQLSGNLYLLSE